MMQPSAPCTASASRLCLLVVGLVSSCSVSDGVLGRVLPSTQPTDASAVGAWTAKDGVPDGPWRSEKTIDARAPVDSPLADPWDSGGPVGPWESEHPIDSGTPPGPRCRLTSPLVTVKNHRTCTGRLAATHFSNALCVCKGLHPTDYLTTHGFDSSQGPYQALLSDDGGAAVGVNGDYSALAGATDIAGSFSVAGTSDMRLVGILKVRGDLYAAGNILGAGGATVGRNAWLGGGFTALAPFTVLGDLRHAGTIIALPLSAGSNRKQPVTVPQPCPCQASELLDVAALVDAAKLDNDNVSLGVSPEALASVVGPTRWPLPCGQVHLSGIGGLGSLVVEVAGPAALFVDGSIDLKGGLAFNLAPGAEIDVFVKGDFLVRGGVSLSDKDRPAAGRIWVGGAQPITLATPWVGNLYAPKANVSAIGGLEVWGAIFAGDFGGLTFASFIFDRAVLAAGANCSAPRPPAGLCTKCEWCSGGTACVEKQCGPCHTDSDCCSLSVCANGSCMPLFDPGQ